MSAAMTQSDWAVPGGVTFWATVLTRPSRLVIVPSSSAHWVTGSTTSAIAAVSDITRSATTSSSSEANRSVMCVAFGAETTMLLPNTSSAWAPPSVPNASKRLPHYAKILNNTILTGTRRRDGYARRSGMAVVEMLRRGITARQIMTRQAFENAIAVAMALGGSTNAVLHLIAMARSVEVPLTIDDFQAVSDRIPYLGDLKPSGSEPGLSPSAEQPRAQASPS